MMRETGESTMSRRALCLLSLLLVAEAIVVNGRGPRPVSVSDPSMTEVTRIYRLRTAL
jgi:hypothetical protein